MSEIPQDILNAARTAATLINPDMLPGEVHTIARAIMAERERCRDAAEAYDCGLHEYPSDEAKLYYEAGVLDASLGIAVRIHDAGRAALAEKEGMR